jgi:outer membrane protein TolC
MRKLFLLLCCPLLWLSLPAQESHELSFEDFFGIVKQHHPLALQARLQEEVGRAELQSARGKFDPKTVGQLSQKYYDDTQYYSLLNAGLKVPTWLGIELEGGYKNNDGSYLNPENKVPEDGLWYAGVSIPLGQDLFIDQRRATLRKAKLFYQSSKAMQQLLLNDLLLEAAEAYWSWFKAYHSLKVYEEAENLALERFQAVKESAFLGDKASIDTVEAGIQWQNRLLARQEAEIALAQAAAELSLYLWADGLLPLELNENTFPPAEASIQPLPPAPELLLQADSLLTQHPKLEVNRFKLDQLHVEERLRKEQLKPSLNLKYQPLVENINGQWSDNYSLNNYQWGVEFSFPLFLRQQRGELNKVQLQQQEGKYRLSELENSLRNKLQAALKEWEVKESQSRLYQRTVQDYGRLLQGEQQLFSIGESSLFMVNSREMGYINSRIKYLELLSKNRLAEMKTRHRLGTLSVY